MPSKFAYQYAVLVNAAVADISRVKQDCFSITRHPCLLPGAENEGGLWTVLRINFQSTRSQNFNSPSLMTLLTGHGMPLASWQKPMDVWDTINLQLLCSASSSSSILMLSVRGFSVSSTRKSWSYERAWVQRYKAALSHRKFLWLHMATHATGSFLVSSYRSMPRRPQLQNWLHPVIVVKFELFELYYLSELFELYF